MQHFEFNTTPLIKFGSGCLEQLGNITLKKIGNKILIITDKGIIETGIIEKALRSLKEANVDYTIFSDVQPDPPESNILESTNLSIEKSVDGIIGIGGGSSLDVAKVTAVLSKQQEKLNEIYGIDNIKGHRLPLILIPTTAGTGSEVTPVSIVTTGKSEKMGVVSNKIIPDAAILDPELTMGLPPHITAATGIDAMVHAIEAYTSKSQNNNPISRSLAKKALRLMGKSIETAVHSGSNIEARSNMLLGSMFAGQAFANSPVAAVHALAYPIGGHFKVPHGLSNALVLPHVLKFNAVTSPHIYSEIAYCVFPNLKGNSSQDIAQEFVEKLSELSKRCGLQQKLSEVGIKSNSLNMLAREAMNQTRLLVNNPRDLNEKDAFHIYKAAL